MHISSHDIHIYVVFDMVAMLQPLQCNDKHAWLVVCTLRSDACLSHTPIAQCFCSKSALHLQLATFLALTDATLLASVLCQGLDPLVDMPSWSPGVTLYQLGEAEALPLGGGALLKAICSACACCIPCMI